MSTTSPGHLLMRAGPQVFKERVAAGLEHMFFMPTPQTRGLNEVVIALLNLICVCFYLCRSDVPQRIFYQRHISVSYLLCTLTADQGPLIFNIS